MNAVKPYLSITYHSNVNLICRVSQIAGSQTFYFNFQKQKKEKIKNKDFFQTLSSSEFKPSADALQDACSINVFLHLTKYGIGSDIRTCLRESGCLPVKTLLLNEHYIEGKSMC